MKRTFKVVVTGGAGFIGSHITEQLIKQGYRVIVIDDLSTGSLNNIKHLFGENLHFLRNSIVNLPLLQKTFSGIDYVFHQAAIASVPFSIENPIASHEANLTGTLNVLVSALKNKVKKVICASSCAVYGNKPTIPKKEFMSADPQSPYAVTKLAVEHYCEVFNRVYGLPTVCLRYFNVYGPRQNPNSQYAAVIPKFIKRLFSNRPPIIYGDGEQTRDFVFVQDVVSANLLAAQSNVVGVFNIGTGERISLNNLAQVIINLLNKIDIQPTFEKERAGDIRHSLADITKAQQFGFRPEYNIERGVRETLTGFSSNEESIIKSLASSASVNLD